MSGTLRVRIAALSALLVHIVLLTFLVLPASAPALLVEKTVEQLSANARSVVVADVVSTAPSSDAAEGVKTEVHLDIHRSLKGARSGRITIHVPGGMIDGSGVHVPGAATFTPGERVVLFLDAENRVVGGRQGRLGVIAGHVPEMAQSISQIEMRITGHPSSARLPSSGESAAISEQDEVSTLAVQPTAGGPTLSGITPASAAAGVGDDVTLSGSGFGTVQGQVLFFYRANADGTNRTIPGYVTYWSNTLIRVIVPVGTVDGYPASASSGPVVVRRADGGLSNSRDFHVTFSYSGKRWPVLSTDFYYDSTNSVAGGLAAVRNAAATWSRTSAMDFLYAGAGEFSNHNHRNEVGWRDMESGVLGRAYILFRGDEIVATDFAFNTAYAWGDGSNGTFDMESCALHEMGHWLCLRDLYGEGDKVKVMYGVSTGVKRLPHSADREGAVWIYGPPTDIDLTRLAGADRYQTALAISRDGFPDGSAVTVVMATGSDYADTLSASGLAGSLRAPLLLTPTDSLPSGLMQELDRLGARRTVLVGGPTAISLAVQRTLDAKGFDTERLAGANRYSTASEVARRIATNEGDAFVPEAFIVRGDHFADALAIAPYAYSLRRPILLVRPDAAPEDSLRTIADLGIESAVVLGGSQAVTAKTAGQLGVEWVRIAGPDRYATGAAIVRHALEQGWGMAEVVGVSTGHQFPDALGGGAAIGANGGVILLTSPDKLNNRSRAILDENAEYVRRILVFGGDSALSEQVVADLYSVWID